MRAKAVLRKNGSSECAYCGSPNDDEVSYGPMFDIGPLTCHYFCVLLSSRLMQRGRDTHGLLGFLLSDISDDLSIVAKKKCTYCNRPGAAICCCKSGCRVRFHLTCGIDNGALNLFEKTYQSFCKNHRKRQKVPLTVLEQRQPIVLLSRLPPKKNLTKKCIAELVRESYRKTLKHTERKYNMANDICCICFDLVNFSDLNNSFWPVCCKAKTLIHKQCLSRMAISAGQHFLRCPLCNNSKQFIKSLIDFGIYIPEQDAAWERERGAFRELYERPSECSALVCSCPSGRNYKGSSWDMKYCKTCGSQCQHDLCLNHVDNDFECSQCVEILSRLNAASSNVGVALDDTDEDEYVDVVSIDSSPNHSLLDQSEHMVENLDQIKYIKKDLDQTERIMEDFDETAHIKEELDSAPSSPIQIHDPSITKIDTEECDNYYNALCSQRDDSTNGRCLIINEQDTNEKRKKKKKKSKKKKSKKLSVYKIQLKDIDNQAQSSPRKSNSDKKCIPKITFFFNPVDGSATRKSELHRRDDKKRKSGKVSKRHSKAPSMPVKCTLKFYFPSIAKDNLNRSTDESFS